MALYIGSGRPDMALYPVYRVREAEYDPGYLYIGSGRPNMTLGTLNIGSWRLNMALNVP